MADLKTLLGESYKEGMTINEVNAALATKELIDTSVEKFVKKSVFDTTASELAKVKKDYTAKLTDDELRATKQQEILDENNLLKTEKKKLTLETQLAKSGYKEEHIRSLSESFLSGDLEGFGKTMSLLKADITGDTTKQVTSNLLKTTTIIPPAGNTSNISVLQTYQAGLASAQASQDMAQIAYFTRLVQVEANKK